MGLPLLLLVIRSALLLRSADRRRAAALSLIGVAVIDLALGAFAGYQMVLADENGLEARVTVGALFLCTAILLFAAVRIQEPSADRSMPIPPPDSFP